MSEDIFYCRPLCFPVCIGIARRGDTCIEKQLFDCRVFCTREERDTKATGKKKELWYCVNGVGDTAGVVIVVGSKVTATGSFWPIRDRCMRKVGAGGTAHRLSAQGLFRPGSQIRQRNRRNVARERNVPLDEADHCAVAHGLVQFVEHREMPLGVAGG